MIKKHFNAKFWLWLGAAGVLLLVISQAIPRASVSDSVLCGLGLAPDAPGFARQENQHAAQLKTQGFLRVCDSNLVRYSVEFEPMSSALAGLDFEPVDLSSSRFANFASLGGRSEVVTDTRSRLYRGFRTGDGVTLTLFEHDMSADGTSTSAAGKEQIDNINGSPAKLVILRSVSGRAVSILSWVQGRRYYEIWLDADVGEKKMRNWLLDLARSLPDSVPACPNEPPPKEVTLNPDGSPHSDPLPAALTQEQFDALIAKPRCK